MTSSPPTSTVFIVPGGSFETSSAFENPSIEPKPARNSNNLYPGWIHDVDELPNDRGGLLPGRRLQALQKTRQLSREPPREGIVFPPRVLAEAGGRARGPERAADHHRARPGGARG